jgi:hypothetical protein
MALISLANLIVDRIESVVALDQLDERLVSLEVLG